MALPRGEDGSPPVFRFSSHWRRLQIILLNTLEQKLARHYRRMDRDLISEAVDDALLNLQAFPERMPQGCPMVLYVEKLACGMLSNLLRSQVRRRRHEVPVGVHPDDFQKVSKSQAGLPDCDDRPLVVGPWLLARLRERLNPVDQRHFDLLARGAARAEWVAELGIADLPEAQQRHRTYRERERLRKRLSRLAQRIQFLTI
jgi:hypothetical protein